MGVGTKHTSGFFSLAASALLAPTTDKLDLRDPAREFIAELELEPPAIFFMRPNFIIVSIFAAGSYCDDTLAIGFIISCNFLFAVSSAVTCGVQVAFVKNVCVCTCVLLYYTCLSECLCVHTRVHLCVCAHACVCACVRVCTDAHV